MCVKLCSDKQNCKGFYPIWNTFNGNFMWESQAWGERLWLPDEVTPLVSCLVFPHWLFFFQNELEWTVSICISTMYFIRVWYRQCCQLGAFFFFARFTNFSDPFSKSKNAPGSKSSGFSFGLTLATDSFQVCECNLWLSLSRHTSLCVTYKLQHGRWHTCEWAPNFLAEWSFYK